MSFEIDFPPQIGAEARIEAIQWDGKPAIRKIRVPKSYRNSELDMLLRSRRTRSEVEAMHTAKLAGVDTPKIYIADPARAEIIMEYVKGTTLKQLDKNNSYFEKLGEYAARLHASGLVHGDLTTKNAIGSGERLVLIDFGLSFSSNRIEDRAEELHLLKQALKSACTPSAAKNNFECALRGYESVSGIEERRKIQNQIAQKELRGRYARVD